MARFNENTRVKYPAIIHLMKLGYKYISLKECKIDQKTNIFIDIFKESLERINNTNISEDEFKNLLIEIQKISGFNDHGKAFYNRLIHPATDLKLVDFDNISNNSFNVVTELPFGTDETFRPDIILIINGIPLAFLEVKKPNNVGGIKAEMDRMNDERLLNEDFRRYFNILQLLCFSNNMKYLEIGKVDNTDSVDFVQGSFYGTADGKKMSFNYFREEEDYENFIKYNTVKTEKIEFVLSDNKENVSLLDNEEFKTNCMPTSPVNSFSNSVLSINRLMFILRYGIIYDGMSKHIMRYQQFFAMKNIINRVKLSIEKDAQGLIDESRALKRGVVWHTQGSGKTELAALTSLALQNELKSDGIICKFYFIVDRLDLLIQASGEFGTRGFAITPIKNKVEFLKELKKPISTTELKESIEEISIVNIQKIMENDEPLETVPNPYGVKVKRIIFVDEAHRSFKNGGTFYTNLMTVDPDAVYIALTGTPIISDKERSTLKFGPYFHKYFYDKSIADGYTLKIKVEPIETKFKNIIKRNIEVEEGSLESKDIITRDSYCNLLSKYINDDFENFKLLNSDPTLGGMIVCGNSLQAEKIYNWFIKNSKLRVALVLDDTKNNKEIQEAFKKTDKDYTYVEYDLLIVFYMLTTGFDVHRLKKMYLLRKADNHGLLQTISRVNRPYTNPYNEYNYHYGYIVDFAGIQNNIDKTIGDYRKELNDDTNFFDEHNIDVSAVITDVDEIKAEFDADIKKLEYLITIDNLEEFSTQLNRYNKDTVYQIKRIIERIKYNYSEFRLSGSKEIYENIDIQKFNKMYKEVVNRIKFMNLLERPVESIKSDYLSNEEIVVMIFEFIKLPSFVLDLSKFIEDDGTPTGVIMKLITQIKKTSGSKDPRLIKLDEELKRVLNSLLMKENVTEEEFNSKFSKIEKAVEKVNEEHRLLSQLFNNDYGYVEAFYEIVDFYPDIEQEALKQFLIECKKSIDEVLITNKSIYRTKNIFIRTIKTNTTEKLDDIGIYDKLNLMENYDRLLLVVYKNITLII